MKRFFICTLFPFIIFGFQALSNAQSMDDLVERDGLYYKKFTDTPYTGPYIAHHYNGELSIEGVYKNGKEDGVWLSCYERGQLFARFEYDQGRRVGTWVWYFENGERDFTETYIGGESLGFRYCQLGECTE